MPCSSRKACRQRDKVLLAIPKRLATSPIGDGAALCSAAHPSLSGNQRNLLQTPADLNETSLEDILIQIAGFTKDEANKFVGIVDNKNMEQFSIKLRPPLEVRENYILRFNELII